MTRSLPRSKKQDEEDSRLWRDFAYSVSCVVDRPVSLVVSVPHHPSFERVDV